jgi:hypothetical protein
MYEQSFRQACAKRGVKSGDLLRLGIRSNESIRDEANITGIRFEHRTVCLYNR